MSKLLDWLLKRVDLSIREALLGQLSLHLQAEFKRHYPRMGTEQDEYRVYEVSGQYFLNPARLPAPSGWTKLGSGWYGAAFENEQDPGVVYKVSLRAFDGYVRYAAWCLEHCNSAGPLDGMPVVHEMRITPRGTIVVVEKLQALPNDAWGNPDEGIADEASNGDLKELISLVETEFPECSLDVHAGNIMIRPSTGEYILTDPLSMDYESKRKLTGEGDDDAD